MEEIIKMVCIDYILDYKNTLEMLSADIVTSLASLFILW